MSFIGNQALPFDPSRASAPQRDAERFSGNGSTTNFTLSRSVTGPLEVEVYVENVRQEPTVAYNVIANSLQFTGAPDSGVNNIYVIYRQGSPVPYALLPDGSITFSKLANNIRLFTTDNFTGDGGTTTFNLSSDVADANTLMVAVDGVFQRAPIHYTSSNSTITFSSAPPATSNVHVRHLGFRTTSQLTALPAGTVLTQITLEGTTTVSGNMLPSANTTWDLGSSANRWANIYTGDLHLSNEGRNSGNLVDGTKGNWTVQEGETDLYLINNKTGKKYKFSLEEVQ